MLFAKGGGVIVPNGISSAGSGSGAPQGWARNATCHSMRTHRQHKFSDKNKEKAPSPDGGKVARVVFSGASMFFFL